MDVKHRGMIDYKFQYVCEICDKDFAYKVSLTKLSELFCISLSLFSNSDSTFEYNLDNE